jgi:hypothetical protein
MVYIKHLSKDEEKEARAPRGDKEILFQKFFLEVQLKDRIVPGLCRGAMR